MKRVLSILLIAVLFLLSGCAQAAYSEDDVIYNENQGEMLIYQSAEKMANAADCVYEGIVTDISFVAGNPGYIFCISTVYTVLVTDEYKGNVRMIEYVLASGGIKDYKVAEQVQAWRKAGRDDPVIIQTDKYVPVLEIGETYIFFVGERLNDAPYKGCRLGMSLAQFAIGDDGDLKWPAGVVTKEDVYEYFGVNPVARTVLRVGLGIVIVAAVATVAVLLIRKKKKAKKIEQIPEET